MASPVRFVPAGGRVCIVGCGTAGVVAAKVCLEEGLLPTVFEKTARVGGVWRLDEAPNRVAYDSLYTNSSGVMMCISDFPLSSELQGAFPRRHDICDYYEAYVRRFALDKHICFEKEVVVVDRQGTEWVVTVRDQREGRLERYTFDAVFVCTGQFKTPLMPRLPGAESFQGGLYHSSSYRNSAGLQGKDVVVVGIGNSALDIALEAARAGSASVTMVCRSGASIIPVSDFHGRPMDQLLNTRMYNQMPATMRQLLLLYLIRGTNAAFHRHGMPPLPKTKKETGFSNLKEHAAFRRFLEQGQIKLKAGSVLKLQGSAVILTSGEKILADELILCTGYSLDLSCLEERIAQEFVFEGTQGRHLDAYKLVMHPAHPTLCALGFLLSYGNESCVAEMQARWALAHWVGRVALPPAGDVETELQRRRKGQRKYPQFVPYIAYMDDLAQDCGVSPPTSWTMLLRNPSLFWKLQTAPAVPAHYRLAGSHTWPGAADFIASQPSTLPRWLGALWVPPHKHGASDIVKPPHSRL